MTAALACPPSCFCSLLSAATAVNSSLTGVNMFSINNAVAVYPSGNGGRFTLTLLSNGSLLGNGANANGQVRPPAMRAV